jgi:hypothetical protein
MIHGLISAFTRDGFLVRDLNALKGLQALMTAGFSVRGVKKLGQRSGPRKSNSRAGVSQGTDLAYRDKPRALLGTMSSAGDSQHGHLLLAAQNG